MDESVKRRERLKAMRAEASQAEASTAVATSVSPGCLSNPFVVTSGNLPVQEDSFSAPRFDFYTDPMAAFSGNRKSFAGNRTPGGSFTPSSSSGSHMPLISMSPSGTGNPEMAPNHSTQFHTNYLPDQRMYHPPGPYHGSGPYRSPLGMASPLPSHQGTPPAAWNESGAFASYSFPSNVSTAGNFPSPGFGRVGSPSFSSGQGRGHWFGRSPSPNSGRGGSPSPNPGRSRDSWFCNNMSPGSGRGGSPGPNRGRGRDSWFGNNTSPGLGRSGGRGRGSYEHFSAQDRPDRFYHKSMVEDPWEFLEPVIWSRDDTEVKNSNWLPKSVSIKKARVSEAPSQSNSKFNLAEYLAASFNEAVKDSENA